MGAPAFSLDIDDGAELATVRPRDGSYILVERVSPTEVLLRLRPADSRPPPAAPPAAAAADAAPSEQPTQAAADAAAEAEANEPGKAHSQPASMGLLQLGHAVGPASVHGKPVLSRLQAALVQGTPSSL